MRSPGGPLNSRLRNLATGNYKHLSIVLCETYSDILNHVGWLTSETDEQTDRHNPMALVFFIFILFFLHTVYACNTC